MVTMRRHGPSAVRSGCLGQFWKAGDGNFSQAPKRIEEFRSNPRYGGDDTRVDLAFAIYALSHGSSDDQVAAAIHSRDLSHKGDEKRQSEYVDRTIAKARKVTESVYVR